jgi:hypothetical protein
MVSEFRQVTHWSFQRWTIAIGATGLAALLIGVPTVLIPNWLFSRMTPTRWWEYPVWLAASVLTGLIAATFVTSRTSSRNAQESRSELTATASGGLLSAFAVGCPVCNKLVVALIGVSGALQVWAPLQPLLGLASIALLCVALRRRLAGDLVCAVPTVTGRGV